MVLEVSVVGKDAVWILWQDPVGESQFRTLGIGSKAMLSAVENHVPLENCSCRAIRL